MRRRIMVLAAATMMLLTLALPADAGRIDGDCDGGCVLHVAALAWPANGGYPQNIDHSDIDLQAHEEYGGNLICSAGEQVKVNYRMRYQISEDWGGTQDWAKFDFYLEGTAGNGYTWTDDSGSSAESTNNAIWQPEGQWHVLGSRRWPVGQWVDEIHIHTWWEYITAEWVVPQLSWWWSCV